MIAERLVTHLAGAFTELADVDATDLPSVADAVAALVGGEEALLQTTVRVAEFTTATPTYGHRVLAVLLLEGLLDVLTTNWDNCIERGNEHERVSAVVNAHDLASISPPSVLKIHGCATQPDSLLITSAHLASPPSWVIDQTRARLGASTVVFVGIGDVAGYVKLRIQEAIGDIGSVANIRVVSPGIVDHWTESQWATLAPDLVDEHRIAATADEFLEQLARAYVFAVVEDMRASFAADPLVSLNLLASATSIFRHDALTVLSWARQAAVVPKSGTPVLSSTSMALALCALGQLAPSGFSIRAGGLHIADRPRLEVLVATGYQPAARLEREARNRRSRYAGLGEDIPQFLIAGGIGWGAYGELPRDILSVGGPEDILDGPLNGVPDILLADEVLR